MARVGVVTFPGSNCERETRRAFASIAGVEVLPLWHRDEALPRLDLVVLPGGFSYGDYLRCGAVARFSPLMERVIEFAHMGGYVLGICNGFQILTEAGLLPGALVRNRDLRFIARTVPVRVERTDTPWTYRARVGQVLHLPIAHGEGNYVDHDAAFAELERERNIVLRYAHADGRVDAAANVNGSLGNAAGICSPTHNVFGLMPHPERAAETRWGAADGRVILESVIAWIRDDTTGEEGGEDTAA